MKKLLICLLCLCISISSAAFAQVDKPKADSNTFLLSLSGKSSFLNGKVSVIVTKPNGTTEGMALGDITAGNIASKTVLVYEFKTGSDGSWSGQAYLPTPASSSDYGWHNVYVNGETVQSFYLASEGEIAEAIAAVQGATKDTLGAALYNYTVTKEILPLNLSGEYALFTNTSDKAIFVHESMLSFVDDYTTMEGNDITVTFNKAIETARYSYGDADAVKKAIEENTLGIVYDAAADKGEISKLYVTLREKTPTYDTVKITKNLRSAVALVKVNSATKGEMAEIFKSYNDVLLLDLEGDYKNLDSVEVTAELLNKGFTTLETLREEFNKAVIKVKGEKEFIDNETSADDTVISISKGGGGGGGYREEKPKEPSKEEKPSSAGVFSDLESASWAEEYINLLSSKGIINGVGDGKFAPLKEVTREEFLKMLIGAFGIKTENTKTHFSDVDEKMWYAPYISWAVENGIIQGMDENTFGTGKPLSREQMAAIAVRMMEKEGIELSAKELGFTDRDNISSYAKDAVEKIYSAQIIDGMPDGSFMPRANLNRAQAAKVITLIMKVGGLGE